MRNNLPVTDKEIEFIEDVKLISVTDLKGKIIYANKEFIKISGFSEDELFGEPHNIIRHPDMPPEAFEEMWSKLKAGNPWVGIVKNRAKNGDYYWVSAYVTPYYEKGELIGYQSVRSKPKPEWITRAEILYSLLLKKKNKIRFSPNPITSTAAISMLASFLVAYSLVYFDLLNLTSEIFIISILLICNVLALSIVACKTINKSNQAAYEIIDSAIARYIYTGKSNYTGQVKLAKMVTDMMLDLVLHRVSEDAKRINNVSYATNGISKISLLGVQAQKDEIVNARVTMESAASAISEVHAGAEKIVETISIAAHTAASGRDSMLAMANSFSDVLNSLDSTANTLSKSRDVAKQVTAATSLLSEIGKKTELLALNSAVEAARAGEYGRGFAVVADEIRTLAKTSHDSAARINDLFADLSTAIDTSVEQMQETKNLAIRSSEKAEENSKEVAEIANQVGVVESSAKIIDETTKHQSDLSDSITRSLTNLDAVADQAIMAARQANDASENLLELSEGLESLLHQFDGTYENLNKNMNPKKSMNNQSQIINDSSVELF